MSYLEFICGLMKGRMKLQNQSQIPLVNDLIQNLNRLNVCFAKCRPNFLGGAKVLYKCCGVIEKMNHPFPLSLKDFSIFRIRELLPQSSDFSSIVNKLEIPFNLIEEILQTSRNRFQFETQWCLFL